MRLIAIAAGKKEMVCDVAWESRAYDTCEFSSDERSFYIVLVNNYNFNNDNNNSNDNDKKEGSEKQWDWPLHAQLKTPANWQTQGSTKKNAVCIQFTYSTGSSLDF